MVYRRFPAAIVSPVSGIQGQRWLFSKLAAASWYPCLGGAGRSQRRKCARSCRKPSGMRLPRACL